MLYDTPIRMIYDGHHQQCYLQHIGNVALVLPTDYAIVSTQWHKCSQNTFGLCLRLQMDRSRQNYGG